MQNAVKVLIPYKGDTFYSTIKKLADIGFIEKGKADALSRAIHEESKIAKKEARTNTQSSRKDIAERLKEHYNENLYALTIEQETTKRDNWRIVFGGMDIFVDDIPVTLIGTDHYTAADKINLSHGYIGLGGWDELYSYALRRNLLDIVFDHKDVGQWSGFNTAIASSTDFVPSATDLRVAGSAGIKDFVEHFFVISQKNYDNLLKIRGEKGIREELRPETLRKNKTPIYVAENYMHIYKALLRDTKDNPFNIIPVRDVEDALTKNKDSTDLSLGFEIVSTGKTLNEKGLCALKPILTSETVVMVNERRYKEDKRINTILEKLDPQFYYDERRVLAYKKWYDALEQNLKTWLPETKDAARMFLEGHNYGHEWRNDLGIASSFLPREGEPFYGLPSTYRKLDIDACARILEKN